MQAFHRFSVSLDVPGGIDVFEAVIASRNPSALRPQFAPRNPVIPMAVIALEISQSPAPPVRKVFNLPLTVGRGSSCDIQLAANNRAISRVHVELAEERGRTVVYNRASNLEATQFNGRPMGANERAELRPGDRITIFGTVLTLLEPARLGIMISRRSDLKPVGDYHLLPGAAVLATEQAGELAVETVNDLPAFDAAPLADKLALLFYYDGPEPTCALLSNPEGLPLLLDRGLVDQQALYLRAEDTLEIGTFRYEVVTIGEASIVCENPACQVLNGYDRGETCRMCGTRLFGATRLLRVRKI